MVLTVSLKVGLSVWSGRLVARTPAAAPDA